MKTINSLLLVTLFSFYGTLRPTQPQGIYAFCNYLGTLTDKWLSDGDLSPEQQKMFEDITQTMGLEYRMLKAKKRDHLAVAGGVTLMLLLIHSPIESTSASNCLNYSLLNNCNLL